MHCSVTVKGYGPKQAFGKMDIFFLSGCQQLVEARRCADLCAFKRLREISSSYLGEVHSLMTKRNKSKGVMNGQRHYLVKKRFEEVL